MLAPPSAFLEHLQCLPPLPVVAQRILAITGSGTASAQEVARTLSQDPAIAARILRVANSPFYGASREITQISRAVVLLGARAVRSFVVAMCARTVLSDLGPSSPEHAVLWNHATAAATACELLARQVGFSPAEEAFVAGLLHDTGHLAMVDFRPELLREVVRGRPGEAERLERERAAFGLDHTEAGYQILSNWNLPDPLCQAARQHHQPPAEIVNEADRLSVVAQLADLLAHLLGFGFDVPLSSSRTAVATARRLGLTAADLGRLLAALDRRLDETRDALACISGTKLNTPTAQALRRAAWIGTQDDLGVISRFLLERAGYELTGLTLDEAERAVSDLNNTELEQQELIVVEAAAQEPARRLAAALMNRGCRRVVLLRDEGHESPGQPAAAADALRVRDPASGVCYLPRLFSAPDLAWLERSEGT